MTRTPDACRGAVTILLGDPELQSPEARQRALAHSIVCPYCADVLDDADASRRVLDALGGQRPRLSTVLRVALVTLASAQLIVALPWLFGASLIPDQDVAVAHLTRDGALGVIVAAAVFLVAWRPRHALVALLVGVIVFVIQFATGIHDDHGSDVTISFELTHLLVFAIVGLLAFATSSGRTGTPDAEPTRRRLHSL